MCFSCSLVGWIFCDRLLGKCLYLSGLTPEQMNAYDDYKLKDIGIGFTNIVDRTSRSSADLTRSVTIFLGSLRVK